MSPVDDYTSFDCIIVGAGFSPISLLTYISERLTALSLSPGLTGIIAAQHLLQAHPETRLAILERYYCVGGVWSERAPYLINALFPFISFPPFFHADVRPPFQVGFTPAFGRNGHTALPSSPI